MPSNEFISWAVHSSIGVICEKTKFFVYSLLLNGAKYYFFYCAIYTMVCLGTKFSMLQVFSSSNTRYKVVTLEAVEFFCSLKSKIIYKEGKYICSI